MRESPTPAELSPAVLILIGLGLFSSVCLLDRVTGGGTFFGFLYLIPIYFAAWSGGLLAGEIMAVLSYFGMILWRLGSSGVTLRDGFADLSSVFALAFFVGTAFVVSRLSGALRRERDLSSHDALTGVFNRREFFHLAEVERLRAIRYARAITLVYIDLDDFKAVNDRFGHAAGDTLLVTIAKTLKFCVRGTDLVARLGGDEFILLLEETDSEAARAIVIKLRDSLADQLAQTSCPVKASMGVITFVTPPASVDAMVHAADELMYTAKHSGGDCAIFRVTEQPFTAADTHVSGA
jgi:diguanylate cyclase (GGDEF)-like protein